MTSNLATKTTANQLQQFSMPVSDSWIDEDVNQARVQTKADSVQKYRLQIQGDTITANLNDFNGTQTNSEIGKNPARVARRNARERRRIKNVNSAFDELRQHVPNGDRNRKKISKVDTLQSAIEYIKALEDLVRNRRSLSGQGGLNCDKENAPTQNTLLLSDAASMDEDQMTVCDSASTDSENDDVIFVEKTQNDKPKQHNNHSQQINHKTEQIPENISDCSTKKSNSKVQRPTEITESMLKAFDVMLQKCTSANNVDVSSGVANTINNETSQANNETKLTNERSVTLCDASNGENGGKQVYNLQHRSNDSGFSEILEQAQQAEKTCLLDSSHVNCNIGMETYQSSSSDTLQEFYSGSTFFNQNASTGFPDNSASFLGGNQHLPAVRISPGYSQDTVKSNEQAMASNNDIVAKFADNNEDKLISQMSQDENDNEISFSGGAWSNPNSASETANFNYSPTSHPTTLSTALWADAESDTTEYVNPIQGLGESFDVQTSFVPTPLDQINPSIDLFSLSECSFDLNFSPASSTSPYEQTNLPYPNATDANETGWILAQLN